MNADHEFAGSDFILDKLIALDGSSKTKIIKTRQDETSGTVTLNSSSKVTLEDIINLGVNAADVKLKYAMSTLVGPFCTTVSLAGKRALRRSLENLTI
jgi:hypothetical protein